MLVELTMEDNSVIAANLNYVQTVMPCLTMEEDGEDLTAVTFHDNGTIKAVRPSYKELKTVWNAATRVPHDHIVLQRAQILMQMRIARFNAVVVGMQEENKESLAQNKPLAYDTSKFDSLAFDSDILDCDLASLERELEGTENA